jgi:hypothetical protein
MEKRLAMVIRRRKNVVMYPSTNGHRTQEATLAIDDHSTQATLVFFITHYVRKAHSRCARTKNGDPRIARLRHRVSH